MPVAECLMLDAQSYQWMTSGRDLTHMLQEAEYPENVQRQFLQFFKVDSRKAQLWAWTSGLKRAGGRLPHDLVKPGPNPDPA